MSAKGILKKIREIYVKLAARKLVGNFRYRKFWSDKASAFMRDRELFSFVENTDDSLGSAFVRDVREYYNYYGEYDLQAINLALSLLRDIYSPEVLPVELCEEVFGRKRTAELIGEELFELLCKFEHFLDDHCKVFSCLAFGNFIKIHEYCYKRRLSVCGHKCDDLVLYNLNASFNFRTDSHLGDIIDLCFGCIDA